MPPVWLSKTTLRMPRPLDERDRDPPRPIHERPKEHRHESERLSSRRRRYDRYSAGHTRLHRPRVRRAIGGARRGIGKYRSFERSPQAFGELLEQLLVHRLDHATPELCCLSSDVDVATDP